MIRGKVTDHQMVIGWREWLTLPGLFEGPIKGKLDTGARTSAIHALKIQSFTERGAPHVSFIVHPLQRKITPAVHCTAEILDEREVKSSNGHRHRRYVIEVEACLGGVTWPIEMTLANREMMGFRLLLGRQALQGKFLIDTNRSFIAGRSFADLTTSPALKRRTT